MRPHWLVLISCLMTLPAQALEQPDVPTPGEALAPAARPSQVAPSSDVIMYALSLIGVNYKYGGTSPATGLDCSGFVKHVFDQTTGLSLPHNALAISRFGSKISTNELQPGDLVFFKTLRRAFSHVGIYLGDNRFVHAATNGGGVEIVSLKESYWAKRFNGARRLLFSRQTPEVSAE
ncbi:MAG: C40 family peptidase [Pseudomonadota bacterium]